MKNANLHAAKVNKNDEFFTTLHDIVSEMRNYTQYFRDKVIYCPCDKEFNIGKSNFVKYFMAVFHTLGIRKLICTQYNPNGQGQLQVIDFANHGFKWEYHGEYKDGTDINIEDTLEPGEKKTITISVKANELALEDTYSFKFDIKSAFRR